MHKKLVGDSEKLDEVYDAQEEDYHNDKGKNNDGKTITNQESNKQEKQFKL